MHEVEKILDWLKETGYKHDFPNGTLGLIVFEQDDEALIFKLMFDV
jgi:hypothetical protein